MATTFDIEKGTFVNKDEPNIVLSGNGPPDESIGESGSLYIDVLEWVIYRKEDSWGEPHPLIGGVWESIKGDKGEDGLPGDNGEAGVGIASIERVGTDLVITLTDGTARNFLLPDSIHGADGMPGKDGRGIASIIKTAPDTAQIIYTDGETQSIILPAGKDGREIELGRSQTHVQWRYVGTDNWYDLFVIPKTRGGGGGGAHKLHDLSDINFSGISDGDVLVYNSATSEFEFEAQSSAGVWGGIGGTLSNQTDLQSALDAKASIASLATVAFSGAHSDLSGLSADDHTQYHTDARALTWLGTRTTADLADSSNKRYVTDAQLVVIGNTSGTNTGDQTITLTGDVTGSGTGSFTTAIAAGVIVNADVNASAAIALSKLAALAFSMAVVTNGSGALAAHASTTATEVGYLTGVTSAIQTQLDGKQATGNYITALTGDGTASGPGSAALTLATVNSNVGTFGDASTIPIPTVNAKGLVTAVSTATVVAPAGTLTGATLAANVLASSLTSVGTLTGGATGAGFTIALSTSTVTGDLAFANLTQGSARSVLGVTGNSTADFASIQGATDQVLRINGAGTALAFGAIDLSKSAAATGVIQAASFPALTGDVTTVAGALATTIANNAVTYAKMQDVSATSRVLGRITSGSGDVEELTGANIATIANASFDHGTLLGLADDDHTQYALLLGRSGGQSLIGGTASGNNLTLSSTSHATKGKILFATNGAYDQVNDRWGFGTQSPNTPFAFVSTFTGITNQNALTLSYTLTPSGDITSGSIIDAALSVNLSTAGAASLTDLQTRALSFINQHDGTGTLNSALGATGAVRWSSSGSISSGSGIVGNIQPTAGSTGTIGTCDGVRGSANFASLASGQVVTTYSALTGAMIAQAASTTITNLRMVSAGRPVSSGTITNGYGVYIDNQTSSGGTHTNVPYGVHQVGTADRNYFGSIIGLGNIAPVAIFDVSMSLTKAAWGANGIGLRVAASTFTDSSSSGTVATQAVHGIARPTLVASSATTYTDSATLYIANSPLASTNVTQTAAWALWIDAGDFRLDGSLGSTGARVTKGWLTDLEITNAPTLNGTAATGSGGLARATSPTFVTPILGAGSATSLTFTSTAGIIGTTTNDNAAAGSVGEFISSSVAAGSAVSLTTLTPANVTSISLTAGDWDLSGCAFFTAGATTATTTIIGAINTTSATLPTSATNGYTIWQGATVSGNILPSLSLWSFRLSLSGTTTVYLVAYGAFVTSTLAAYGFIGARRRR